MFKKLQPLTNMSTVIQIHRRISIYVYISKIQVCIRKGIYEMNAQQFEQQKLLKIMKHLK